MGTILYFLGKCWKELLYTLVFMYYYKNVTLLNNYFILNNSTPLEVFMYNDYQAVGYCVFALLLVIVAAFLMWFRISSILEEDKRDASFVSISIVLSLILLVMLLITIKTISIPILKSVAIVLFGGGLVLSAQKN